MFTEGLGEAFSTSHPIDCPTTTPPPVRGTSASMGGSVSALCVQSPSQCFQSTLLNATRARGSSLPSRSSQSGMRARSLVRDPHSKVRVLKEAEDRGDCSWQYGFWDGPGTSVVSR